MKLAQQKVLGVVVAMALAFISFALGPGSQIEGFVLSPVAQFWLGGAGMALSVLALVLPRPTERVPHG